MERSPSSSSFIESSLEGADPAFDVPMRPERLCDFTGQRSICQRLQISIEAALQRGEVLGHCLFCGPPGLGKTTLAHIVAKAMGGHLLVTSGPALEKAGDLAGLLTKLQKGDVLFIDEVHRLQRNLEEYLYTAMEDFKIDIIIDSGPGATSVQLPLHPFTLVAATTREGMITSPLRTRFGLQFRLAYYGMEELESIVMRSAALLALPLCREGASHIARRSRGTPRIANHLLRWVRDFATVHPTKLLAPPLIDEALAMLHIDERGLGEMDLKILEVICCLYEGGPVGIQAIASAVGEEPSTLEEVYEPFLVLQGLVRRTPRGREATDLAFAHLEQCSRQGMSGSLPQKRKAR